MAQLASKRATAEEKARFKELAKEMSLCARKDDDVGFMRLDRELNLLISRACRNEFAQRAMGLTHGLSRRFWYMHYKQVLDLPRCAKLHAALAAAIGEGDDRKAMQASDELLDYIESFTRAALDAPFSFA
jgi:DNA-binding FadR family transcriptional regulator